MQTTIPFKDLITTTRLTDMSNIRHLLAVLLFVPALCPAQTATENYVKTVTMLDAAGTESLQAVQYYPHSPSPLPAPTEGRHAP